MWGRWSPLSHPPLLHHLLVTMVSERGGERREQSREQHGGSGMDCTKMAGAMGVKAVCYLTVMKTILLTSRGSTRFYNIATIRPGIEAGITNLTLKVPRSVVQVIGADSRVGGTMVGVLKCYPGRRLLAITDIG
ncbi:hypothetical protein Bbelb_032050 [Branchiostoma belcheri]|nr:hypothetical protein Bbelb_032050 [Branchiostoma belcheri]